MGKGFLYRLSDDPAELHNLWYDPTCQEKKQELLTALAAEMMKQTDPLPVPHYRYRVKVHPKGFWHQDFVADDPGVRKMKPIGERYLEEE